MKKILLLILILTAAGGFMANASETAKIYSFQVKTIDGKGMSMAEFKGKTLLIVNVASRCGFTPQYKGLEALYEKYKDKGLIILGFPANNFMFQEPGDNEEIKKFCSLKYNVTFPMFSKIEVKGKNIDPLYQYLTQESESPAEVSWNFNKFLVTPEGRVAAHFGSKTEPESKELVEKLEVVLPKA
jgi:glutathione peroxidase-family protein